jgi:chorismate lyase/3-hydroxybenzoate synthase
MKGFFILNLDYHKVMKGIKIVHSQDRNSVFRTLNFEKKFNFQQALSSTPIPALGLFSKEFFILDGDVQITQEQKNDIFHIATDEYTFLRITHNEKKYQNIENASYQAYKKIFDYASRNPNMKYLRAWNYIPYILRVDGLERYREFNIGRWNAWQNYGPKLDDGTPIRPAATAIGSFDNPLIIEALFTKYPVIHIENPRQKQFVEYSVKWGTKPPVSARGTIHLHPDGTEVWIAGTASLLGEEVAHENDVEEQTRETLRNIKILISKENLKEYDIEFNLKNLIGVRVYIKNQKDLQAIRSIVEKELGHTDILYLHDDICRPGFLLEIEAVAR